MLVGSFFITLKVLDYTDDTKREPSSTTSRKIEDIRPTSWKKSGGASYDVRGGYIVMHGPNYIYIETDCKQCSKAEFSISLQNASIANMQLLFLNLAGTAASEPAVQNLSGMGGKVIELRAAAPPGTSRIRALVYSPQSGDVATFTDPILRIEH